MSVGPEFFRAKETTHGMRIKSNRSNYSTEVADGHMCMGRSSWVLFLLLPLRLCADCVPREIFSRVEATLYEGVSVGPSVGP